MKQYLKQKVHDALWRRGYQITRVSTYRTGVMAEIARLPIRSVLDIGAADGDTAGQFLHEFPDAHVYAFEPLPTPYAALARMAAAHPSRLSAYNLALGTEEGEVEMSEHVGHSASSSLLSTTSLSSERYPKTATQRRATVRLTTLDAWAASLPTPPAAETLVKMDCQGYEDRVVRGGAETLRRARACLIEVMFKPLYEGQATFRDLFGLMDGLGFRYHGNLEQGVGADGLVQADVLFVR